MKRDRRLFAKFDLDYADNPKIMPLSDAAFRAHVEMILYARKYLTDGIIPKRFANRFATSSLTELLHNDDDDPSLMDNGDGSFTLYGYADMNETKADVEARSRANTENGRRGGRAKAANVYRVAKRKGSESPSESVSEKGSEIVAETETETEKRTTDVVLYPSPDSAFDLAWAHWPKKTERKASAEKFRQAARKIGVDTLTAHVVRFGDAYAATTDRNFVPALCVWLNRERWTDPLPTPPTQRMSPMARNLQTYGEMNDERGRSAKALDSRVGA